MYGVSYETLLILPSKENRISMANFYHQIGLVFQDIKEISILFTNLSKYFAMLAPLSQKRYKFRPKIAFPLITILKRRYFGSRRFGHMQTRFCNIDLGFLEQAVVFSL